MKGFGCFIVTLLNCLILRFLLISKGYTSQVREGRPAPRFPRGAAGRPPNLEYPGQVAISSPETVRKGSLLLRSAGMF